MAWGPSGLAHISSGSQPAPSRHSRCPIWRGHRLLTRSLQSLLSCHPLGGLLPPSPLPVLILSLTPADRDPICTRLLAQSSLTDAMTAGPAVFANARPGLQLFWHPACDHSVCWAGGCGPRVIPAPTSALQHRSPHLSTVDARWNVPFDSTIVRGIHPEEKFPASRERNCQGMEDLFRMDAKKKPDRNC